MNRGESHRTEQVSDLNGVEFTAVCSCGWNGEGRRTVVEASQDCEEHKTTPSAVRAVLAAR